MLPPPWVAAKARLCSKHTAQGLFLDFIPQTLRAPQDKAKLDVQVKQLVSQMQLAEKGQEKRDSMEQKKREGIMAVGGRAWVAMVGGVRVAWVAVVGGHGGRDPGLGRTPHLRTP